MISNNTVGELICSPTRKITAGASFYNATTNAYLANWTSQAGIKSIQIERVGESSKFFGFGVCQKANLKLLDPKSAITASFSGTYYKVNFSVGNSDAFYCVPNFYVTEVHRDENTGELSITAYDKLYKTNSMLVSELELPEAPYTLKDVVAACANALGISYVGIDCLNVTFNNQINVEGTETVRELLDDIAEASQSVYWLTQNNELYFRVLNVNNTGRTITKEDYFTLKSGDNRRLTTIYKTNELGDDVYATTGQTGTTQYVRDNVFWEFAEDIDTYLQNAINQVGNLTINQFECSWRGDLRLQIGDRLRFETKDGSTVTTYLLNDTLTYDGSLSQKTEWQFEDNETETADNPTTLGETLKKTYAKVDKANKQIDIVASEVDTNTNAISSLQINTESISSTVSQLAKDTEERLDGVENSVNEFNTNIEQTAENIVIAVKQEISEEGVSKVKTETGFTFDEQGLTVSKSGSNITTTITEDGMTVQLDNTPLLIANNGGVDAMNLHATTYLFIGQNSRFQDYNNGTRTGCFWIGK